MERVKTTDISIQADRQEPMTKAAPSLQRALSISVGSAGIGVFIAAWIVSIVSAAEYFGVYFFDWTFYAGAVNRWLAGEEIYPNAQISTLGSTAGSSYSYPPASVPLMLPFASWPFGAILWDATIVAVLLAGLWSIVRVGWPTHRFMAMGITLACMASLGGVMQGIGVGNVNVATAGAVGLTWAAIRGSGSLAGVLGVVKVFPITLAAPAGVSSLARAAALAGVICLITLPMVGIAAWSDYFHGLQTATPLCGDPAWENYSLACQLAPWLGLEIAKWIGLILAAGLLLVALRSGITFIGVTAATLAIIVPAAELHAHYLTLVVVLVLIGLATLNVRRNQIPRQDATGHVGAG